MSTRQQSVWFNSLKIGFSSPYGAYVRLGEVEFEVEVELEVDHYRDLSKGGFNFR